MSWLDDDVNSRGHRGTVGIVIITVWDVGDGESTVVRGLQRRIMGRVGVDDCGTDVRHSGLLTSD